MKHTSFKYFFALTGTAVLVSAASFLVLRYFKNQQPKITRRRRQLKSREILASGELPPKRFAILFGSQTGTGEIFARTLCRILPAKFLLPCTVIDTTDFNHEILQTFASECCWVIFVVATYGEGEPTDSARSMFRWVGSKKREAGCLEGLRFGVMALGNSQYTQFNAAGKKLERNLLRLGGISICSRGDGDDDRDIEADFELWMSTQLMPTLAEVLGTSVEVDILPKTWRDLGTEPWKFGTTPTTEVAGNEVMSQYTIVRVAERRELRQVVEANLSTTHLELYLSEQHSIESNDDVATCSHSLPVSRNIPLSYETGDTVDILPGNSSEQIQRLYKRLVRDWSSASPPPDLICNVSSPSLTTSLQLMLKYFVDLSGVVDRATFTNLGAFLADSEQRNSVATLLRDSNLFARRVRDRRLTLSDCLDEFFTSAQFGSSLECLGTVLAMLPKSKPRAYTSSSSSLTQPTRVSITVSQLVEPYAKHESLTPFIGHCSSYICGRVAGPQKDCHVLARIRHSILKLPKTMEPLLLIAAGTGIAPFRGFLQELKERARVKGSNGVAGSTRRDWDLPSEVILFFGCTDSNKDFLYKEELELYLEGLDGHPPILTHLVCAFSREQPQKVYVQHKLKQRSKLILDAIKVQKGRVFICGSVKMGAAVKHMLKGIIGEKCFNSLSTQNRLVEEVWI